MLWEHIESETKCRHFDDDTFKRIFTNENVGISIKISSKFVPTGPINYIVTTRGLLGTRTSGHKILEVCIASKRWTCDAGDTQGYLRDDRHSTFKLTKFIYNIQTKLCSIQN